MSAHPGMGRAYLSTELGVDRTPAEVADADVVEEMVRRYEQAIPLIGAAVPVVPARSPPGGRWRWPVPRRCG